MKKILSLCFVLCVALLAYGQKSYQLVSPNGEIKMNVKVSDMACVFTACQDSSLLTIGGLKCEMLESPLAIDNTSPHFSWKMSGKQNGAASTAYQILVATSLDKLNEEEADLWNTGKVADAASVGITYGGKPLASRSLAYWKVRVWNQKDEASDWSKPTLFGIGLLSDQDWAGNASFIGVEQDDQKSQSAPLLRKQFTYNPVEGSMLLRL